MSHENKWKHLPFPGTRYSFLFLDQSHSPIYPRTHLLATVLLLDKQMIEIQVTLVLLCPDDGFHVEFQAKVLARPLGFLPEL